MAWWDPPFNVGDSVQRKDNPRHVGRVIAVLASHIVRVQWVNGWKEDFTNGEAKEDLERSCAESGE
jgi:hypothetical protein